GGPVYGSLRYQSFPESKRTTEGLVSASQRVRQRLSSSKATVGQPIIRHGHEYVREYPSSGRGRLWIARSSRPAEKNLVQRGHSRQHGVQGNAHLERQLVPGMARYCRWEEDANLLCLYDDSGRSGGVRDSHDRNALSAARFLPGSVDVCDWSELHGMAVSQTRVSRFRFAGLLKIVSRDQL